MARLSLDGATDLRHNHDLIAREIMLLDGFAKNHFRKPVRVYLYVAPSACQLQLAQPLAHTLAVSKVLMPRS
jgi:hypothetical protein